MQNGASRVVGVPQNIDRGVQSNAVDARSSGVHAHDGEPHVHMQLLGDAALEQNLPYIPEVLGFNQFERLYSAGTTLTYDEALAIAL